jgi:hypothetical protein
MIVMKNKTAKLCGSLSDTGCDLEIIVLEQLLPVALSARFCGVALLGYARYYI